MFQFWDEPWWDWEFLWYQRPRDCQTDGRSHNSQHQPFLLVCLQQRLHHQLSRVSGWWLFPVGLSKYILYVYVCSREKGACLFSCCHCWPLWWPARLSYIQVLLHLFTSIQDSCQTSLRLCMITRCLPPFSSLHRKEGDVWARVMLSGDAKASCLRPLLHCFVEKSQKTKTWRAQINRGVMWWRLAESEIAGWVLPAWHGQKQKKKKSHRFLGGRESQKKHLELAFRVWQWTMICQSSCNHDGTAWTKSYYLISARHGYIELKLLLDKVFWNHMRTLSLNLIITRARHRFNTVLV